MSAEFDVSAELAALRQQIDDTDHTIIQALAKRFGLTHDVGVLKRDHQLPPVDSDRETAQFAQFGDWAEQYGVNPELVDGLFRLIIDAAVANHEQLRTVPVTGPAIQS